MNEQYNTLMLHIGPLRSESSCLIQNSSIPSLVVCPPIDNALCISLPDIASFSTAWVTPQGNKKTSYRYSLDDFSSLAEGVGLKELYPGVRLKLRETVETRSISEVLKDNGVESNQLTALVIEQVDQAMPLLEEFKTQGLLENLCYLWVRTSPIRLYQDNPRQQELIGWCEEQGFEPLTMQSEDPEFNLQAFKRNRLYKVLKKAQEQSREHSTKLEIVSLDLEEIRKKLDTSQKDAIRLKDEREALRKEVQTLKQKNQQMITEASETQQKQHQLKIELERAESQLELIKELLLKDKLLSN